MRKYIRKATRTSRRSIAVVLPAEIVDNLKIRARQKLTVRQSGQRIIIEDWKR